nr:hypothetical protein [uncultured Pseudomonas sp.]
MDAVNTPGFSTSAAANATVVRRQAQLSEAETVGKMDPAVAEEEPQLSPLAKQLSYAAVRAAHRDSLLSRKELAELAAQIRDRIGGANYTSAKEFYDAQKPDTDNVELLDRARHATDFINGEGSNPFKGLSRDQLSLITYDESGSFTINERRAASWEADAQHQEWARYIIDKMDIERQRTGRSDEALLETIHYYDSLPRIEVAAYGNYEAMIRMQMGAVEIEWPEFNTSLLDMVANEWKPAAERENAAGDAGVGPVTSSS